MTTRDRNVLLAVAVLIALAASWFLLVAPKRKEAAALTDKVAVAQTRLDAALLGVVTAEKARSSYAADYATVARLGKAVTVDDQVPSLLYTLQSIAERYRIDFRDMTGGGDQQPAPQPQNSTNAGQAAAVAATEDKSDGKDTPAAPAAPAVPDAVGTAGFPTMPFSFTFEGTYFDMERFLRAVDRLTVVDGKQITVRGRLLTIDDVTLTEGEGGFPRVQAVVAATAFLLPAEQGLTAGATPTGPASTVPAAGGASASTPAPSSPPVATASIGAR